MDRLLFFEKVSSGSISMRAQVGCCMIEMNKREREKGRRRTRCSIFFVVVVLSPFDDLSQNIRERDGSNCRYHHTRRCCWESRGLLGGSWWSGTPV